MNGKADNNIDRLKTGPIPSKRTKLSHQLGTRFSPDKGFISSQCKRDKHFSACHSLKCGCKCHNAVAESHPR